MRLYYTATRQLQELPAAAGPDPDGTSGAR